MGERKRKLAVYVLAMLMAAAALTGCGKESSEVSISSASSTAEVSTTESSTAESSAAESSAAELSAAESSAAESSAAESSIEESSTVVSNVASVGDTVTGNGYKITLEKAYTAKSLAYSLGTYSIEETPDDGKIYLITEIEYENTSDESEYVLYTNFQTSVDGYSTDATYLAASPDGLDMLSGTVMPGKKLKGYISYEIDEGWKECEMAYLSNLFNSMPDFTFTLSSNMIEQQ